MTRHDSHHQTCHHQSSVLLQSPRTAQASTRIIQIGIVANLGLASIKLVSGRMLNSKALTADAWHSFSDLTTDFIALLAVLLSSLFETKASVSKSASARIQGLLAIIASGALLAMALHLGWEAVKDMKGQIFGTVIASETKPSLQAIWPSLLTLLVKESLYRTSQFLFHHPNLGQQQNNLCSHALIFSHQSRKPDQISDTSIISCSSTSRLLAEHCHYSRHYWQQCG